MPTKNSKVYAVRIGRRVGIFNSWSECETQVKGYPGAEFSSFKSKDEAISYLENEKKEKHENIIEEINIDSNTSIVAYVDGSYDNIKKEYSCGVVLFKNEEKKTLQSKGNDPELSEMRNVAGEIMGAMVAMQYAIDNRIDGFDRLIIYHDYEGISKWCTGEWKATKKGTIEYKNFYMNVAKQIKVDFVKIKAHSGNKYNEEADQLAKEALYIDSNTDVIQIEQIQKAEKIEKPVKVKKSKTPQIHIKYKDRAMKIEDIIKKVKETWRKKETGRKVSDINTLDVYIDMEKYMYEWEIQAKDGLEKGEIYFSK